jgi:flagellar biosynthesis/type III secretory pathway M-ring protein FliF/YscJ
MDPDLFITIAFSSFVFVVGMVGLILMTVMVLRSHRRAEGPYEQEEPPAAIAQAPRRSPQRTPGRSHARKVHDRSRRSRVRT